MASNFPPTRMISGKLSFPFSLKGQHMPPFQSIFGLFRLRKQSNSEVQNLNLRKEITSG